MTLSVRAVYEQGRLRPIGAVELSEGQEVELHIEAISQRQVIREVLGDLVRWSNPELSALDDDPDAWVEAETDAIDRAFQGEPTLAQLVSQSRGDA